MHLAALRRGVFGITKWGKWMYRLQPAINMPMDLLRWSCRQIVDTIDKLAGQPGAAQVLSILAKRGRGGAPPHRGRKRSGLPRSNRKERQHSCCRFLNAETQNITVPGMLFLPADGMLPAKLRDEGPKL